jgi:hypothetical protein
MHQGSFRAVVRFNNVFQCLSAGTIFPDRIIEAVDLTTPHALMISVGVKAVSLESSTSISRAGLQHA